MSGAAHPGRSHVQRRPSWRDGMRFGSDATSATCPLARVSRPDRRARLQQARGGRSSAAVAVGPARTSGDASCQSGCPAGAQLSGRAGWQGCPASASAPRSPPAGRRLQEVRQQVGIDPPLRAPPPRRRQSHSASSAAAPTATVGAVRPASRSSRKTRPAAPGPRRAPEQRQQRLTRPLQRPVALIRGRSASPGRSTGSCGRFRHRSPAPRCHRA